jgi:hypothetical protein
MDASTSTYTAVCPGGAISVLESEGRSLRINSICKNWASDAAAVTMHTLDLGIRSRAAVFTKAGP